MDMAHCRLSGAASSFNGDFVMDNPYVVIVEMRKWWSNVSWRPIIAPLSRDRPKTIWTKDRWGEIMFHKKNIRYKIFDCEADARKALPTSVSNAITEMDRLWSEWEKQQERAKAAVVDLVKDWEGTGRR